MTIRSNFEQRILNSNIVWKKKNQMLSDPFLLQNIKVFIENYSSMFQKVLGMSEYRIIPANLWQLKAHPSLENIETRNSRFEILTDVPWFNFRKFMKTVWEYIESISTIRNIHRKLQKKSTYHWIKYSIIYQFFFERNLPLPYHQ